MKSEQLRIGLLIRVIHSGLGAPIGSLATVERIETRPNGTLCVSIRYHDPQQTQRGKLYRSHLWEEDLRRVEAFIEGTQPRRNHRRNKVAAPKRIQLELPFEPNGESA